VDFTIIGGIILLGAGLINAVLARSGQIQQPDGLQKYVPYLLLGVGAVIIIVGLMD
jgi:hypothetical protein